MMDIIEASTVVHGDAQVGGGGSGSVDDNGTLLFSSLPVGSGSSSHFGYGAAPTALDDKVFLALVVVSGVLSLLMIRRYLIWLLYQYLIRPIYVRIRAKRDGSMTTRPNRWAKRLSALLSSQENNLVSLPFASGLTLAISLAEEEVTATAADAMAASLTSKTTGDSGWCDQILFCPAAGATTDVVPIADLSSPVFVHYSPPAQHLPFVSPMLALPNSPRAQGKRTLGDGSKSPVEPCHAPSRQDWRLAMKGGLKGPHQIIIS